jgi:hypothetical protein
MESMGAGFARAGKHLEAALALLRARDSAARILDHFHELDDRLPDLRDWLARLAADPAEFDAFPPAHGLLAAQAWRLANPDAAVPSFGKTTGPTVTGWAVTKPTIWFGDSEIDGGLDVRAPLVVLGNLRVHGLLDDGGPADSRLAVSGDTSAYAIASSTDSLTLGNLSAEVIFCFNDDATLLVGGDITAELFVPYAHPWRCDGEVRARAIGDAKVGNVRQLVAPWLPPDYGLADDRESIDPWRILEEAADGESPVLAKPRRATRRPGEGATIRGIPSMSAGFARAAEHLDEAVARLRPGDPTDHVLDHLYQFDLDFHLSRLRAWLPRLATDPDEFHNLVEPPDGLLAAQAWRLANPDAVGPAFPDGAERTENGWRVTEPIIWFGDTHVPGSLEVRAALTVVGDLRVDGLLDDGDTTESRLGVLGNVSARAIASATLHLTLGDVDAAVIFCTGHLGSLVVGGNLTAELFVPDENAWRCDGAVRARAIGAYHLGDVAETVAPWLPPDYVNLAGETDRVDAWRVINEAAAGDSPVLDTPRAVTFPIPPILRAALADPDGVTALDASHQRLHAIPPEAAALTRLTSLTADRTPLGTLDGIAVLAALASLSIRDTPVRTLAPLTQLPKLSFLDISYCQEITDWSALTELRALRTLIAHGCALPAAVRATLATRLGDQLRTDPPAR